MSIQVKAIQQLADQPDVADHERPVLQPDGYQSPRCQRHRLRVAADARRPDQLYAQHRELPRVAALRRFVAEDRPGELPADRFEFVLVTLDVQPRRRCRELGTQAKLPSIHLEVEQAIDGLVTGLGQEQVGIFDQWGLDELVAKAGHDALQVGGHGAGLGGFQHRAIIKAGRTARRGWRHNGSRERHINGENDSAAAVRRQS